MRLFVRFDRLGHTLRTTKEGHYRFSLIFVENDQTLYEFHGFRCDSRLSIIIPPSVGLGKTSFNTATISLPEYERLRTGLQAVWDRAKKDDVVEVTPGIILKGEEVTCWKCKKSGNNKELVPTGDGRHLCNECWSSRHP